MLHASPVIFIYCSVLALVMGAVLGSFLHCAAWRIAHGESWAKGKSHCPTCGHELGVADLVPIFSWVFLRGKCRHCRTEIPARYVAAEALLAILFLVCLLRFDLSPECIRNMVFLCCMFCISLVDLDIMEIPTPSLIVAIVAWGVSLPFMETPIKQLKQGLLGAVIIAGAVLFLSLLMDKLLGKESLGGGDIKLLFVTGLYLGFVSALFALVLACVIGLIFAIFMKRRADENEGHFPFGPSIALGAVIMLLAGGPLVQWYMGLMGL